MTLFKKPMAAFLLSFNLICANTQENSFITDYVSRTWTSSDGLPGNSTTDIIQTSDGYIYIGTYDGLVRFDGIEFQSTNKNTDKDYPFVSARTLFQDSMGNLWVGANDEGIVCIKKDGSIISFDKDDGLPNNSVRSITEDKNGLIWVGTSSGIATIKNEKVFIPEGIENITGANSMLVRQIYCDNANRIWICCMGDPSLIIYSQNQFSTFNSLQKINNPQVTCLTQDSDKNFWFGIAPHLLVKFDGENETLYDVGHGKQQGTLVSCIFQDSNKNLWIGLDSGITIMKNGSFEYMNQQNGLTDEKVVKIIEDREKNIWIATDRGGIEKFGRTKFKTIHTPTTINAISSDEYRNVMWFASDSGLLCYKNGKYIENEITELTKNIRIRDVISDEDGNLFVSCYEKLGQLQIDKNGKLFSWKQVDGSLPGNKVRVSLKARNGNLYIGTTTGLSIVHPDKSIKLITKDFGLSNDYIMCLYEDAEGQIWCGTDGGGVFVLKDEQLAATYTSEDGLAGNVIFKITDFKQDAIWITTGTGISRFKDGNFCNFDASNGLASDSVFQMILDYTDKVWCTTNKGIFAVNLSDLNDFAEGKIQRISSKFFGKSDGIISNGITSTSRSINDKNGKLWFTLTDGVAIYDPILAEQNTKIPQVHIQEVFVDNIKIPFFDNKIEIPSYGKRLNIKFTGISFIAPEQVQFKYKLTGFDAQYSDWTTQRTVSYTNLKPGTYSFSILAQTNDDVQGSLETPLKIIKKPAIWQQPLFWVAIVILSILILVITVRARLSKLRKENQHLQKIYKEITKALAGTIDAKDNYTKGHSARVAEYSVRLAKMLGKSKEEQENIFMQAVLHDIGKIGVPDSIITKPSRLTGEEFEIIKQHPVTGSNILKSITSLKDIGTGARWHHERYDGKGYPDQLKGEEIPEVARIICVADAYDAMTSNRSYRNLLDQKVVREQIEQGKGSQFDPVIADKMLEIIDADTMYLLHG